MLDSLKEKVRNDIAVLDNNIKKNQELIEKRSRKTLDLIAEDTKAKQAYEKELQELENLTKGK